LAVLLLSLVTKVPIAEANCPGGQFRLSAETSPAKGQITLTGQYFMDSCPDTSLSPAARPLKRIRILFVQGKTEREIARVDANAQFEVSTVVTIPADAVSGPASIIMEYNGDTKKMRPSRNLTIIP
jgi:hypothetical protein